MNEVEFIKHCGVLSLQPEDVVVVRSAMQLSDVAFKHLHEKLQQYFPNNKIILIEPGIDVGVIRKRDVAQSGERT